jgi:hypothetical protein
MRPPTQYVIKDIIIPYHTLLAAEKTRPEAGGVLDAYDELDAVPSQNPLSCSMEVWHEDSNGRLVVASR